MTKKIKWRLGNLPEPEEVSLLVKEGILNKEEAREILFSLETDEDRDKKSLEQEIKFLRGLVDKLAGGSITKIVEVIKEVQKPYYQQPWYQPYGTWISGGTGLMTATSANYSITSTGGGSGGGSAYLDTNTPSNFTDIKTF